MDEELHDRKLLIPLLIHGPLTRYVKLQVAHAPGMPGTFSPAADFKGNRKLAIPTCITARAWRTCRDACRDRAPAVTGKTFPAFPAHAHLQFCVSGKRPMLSSQWIHIIYLKIPWNINLISPFTSYNKTPNRGTQSGRVKWCFFMRTSCINELKGMLILNIQIFNSIDRKYALCK